MFSVIKRDGKEDSFNLSRISDAIMKAFNATEVEYTNDIIDLLSLRVTSDFQSKLKDGAVHVEDIQDVILLSSDGTQQMLGIGGYLDVGNHDTMKDLLVNLIGAVVFSVIGYIAAAKKGKSRIAVKFIPQVKPSDKQM